MTKLVLLRASGRQCVSCTIPPNVSVGHSKTRTLPLRLSPSPCAAASKAPRLCTGLGYLSRLRCRRLHITRGHITCHNLTVRAPHPIRALNRVTVGTATTHACSQRLRVSCCATNDGAPLQNPKTFALPVAIRCRFRCRRFEPWFLAATSLPPPEFNAHLRFV